MKTCPNCKTDKCIAVLYKASYLRNLAIRKGMTKAQAQEFVKNFLIGECNRIPDFKAHVDRVLGF
jgi:hypothetical protein